MTFQLTTVKSICRIGLESRSVVHAMLVGIKQRRETGICDEGLTGHEYERGQGGDEAKAWMMMDDGWTALDAHTLRSLRDMTRKVMDFSFASSRRMASWGWVVVSRYPLC